MARGSYSDPTMFIAILGLAMLATQSPALLFILGLFWAAMSAKSK